ncbi:DNA-methyltransferase [Candidatus Vondammii sp. HM_W22]|uniref:DNA-methyltransferase n=1 Tax=Candidatus Vondammii sp. HM_W22 TaxID=2687299 RepID=UPI001F14083E|nr:site-specific DNA-methyltransferase [Candidatus Vondammii sp. HM_W22]
MEFNHNNIKLVKTDCLALLKTISNDSIDLIATDPPYYKVKTDSWDRLLKNKGEFFHWQDQILAEYQRVLKPTGSLYIFCGPYLASETEILVGTHFRVLNHIVWRKPRGRHLGCNKESLTKYFPQTERIIFAESRKRQPFHYEPIRSHLADTLKEAGITNKQINLATDTQMSHHWTSRSQFSLPAEKHYDTLRRIAPKLKPWRQLHSEYMAIRLGPRRRGRFFAVTKHVPFTDVWDFPSAQFYPGKHPCEKPVALMRHIVETSSKPGALVLDGFAGSATTAIAAHQLDRKFIGSEMGETEFNHAVDRLTECLTSRL